MDTTDAQKTAKAREETYRRYLLLHQERAEKAERYLQLVEDRHPYLGEIDQQTLIDSCVRMLIDMSLKKAPAMDRAAAFVRYVLLVPVHMRVPFVNAVASCCQPDMEALPDNAWLALRKKLHGLSNKVGAILYDLNIEFADWKLNDPAQMEMFKTPAEKPRQVLDDGGATVNPETGEIFEQMDLVKESDATGEVR